MATYRTRNGATQAIVRKHRHGVLVYSEARTFPTERLARAWGDKMDRLLDAEGVAAVKRRRATVASVVSDYADEVEAAGQVAANTTRSYVRRVVCEPPLGEVPVAALEAADIVRYAKKRRDDGVSPSTVQVELSFLRGAMEAAKPLFGIEANVAALNEARHMLTRLRLVSSSRKRERRLREGEEEKLMEELGRIEAHPFAVLPLTDLFQFAIALPRRIGEIVRLRRDLVDEGRRIIVIKDVKHPSQKVGNDQTVPLIGESWDILMRQPLTGPLFFPYRAESISIALQRACRRVGIEDLRWHDLRHEGISRLFEQGLSIQQVSIISGHTTWTHLKRYTHIRPESLHEVYENARRQRTEEARP